MLKFVYSSFIRTTESLRGEHLSWWLQWFSSCTDLVTSVCRGVFNTPNNSIIVRGCGRTASQQALYGVWHVLHAPVCVYLNIGNSAPLWWHCEKSQN